MWNSLGVCLRTVLLQVFINDLETEWHRLCTPINPAAGRKWGYKLVCTGKGCLWIESWIQQGHIWDGSTACSSVCWGLPGWREVLVEEDLCAYMECLLSWGWLSTEVLQTAWRSCKSSAFEAFWNPKEEKRYWPSCRLCFEEWGGLSDLSMSISECSAQCF